MDINFLMKQAKELQDKMVKMQEEFAKKEFKASSGAGAVEVIVFGSHKIKKINIVDKSLLSEDQSDLLSDLIVAAINNAMKMAEDENADGIKNSASGLGLPPGFKFPM